MASLSPSQVLKRPPWGCLQSYPPSQTASAHAPNTSRIIDLDLDTELKGPMLDRKIQVQCWTGKYRNIMILNHEQQVGCWESWPWPGYSGFISQPSQSDAWQLLVHARLNERPQSANPRHFTCQSCNSRANGQAHGRFRVDFGKMYLLSNHLQSQVPNTATGCYWALGSSFMILSVFQDQYGFPIMPTAKARLTLLLW